MIKATLRASAIALLVATAIGCATGRAVRNGENAARKSEWDAAITYYRQALASDPSRIDVRIKLERASREAAAAHFARGRALEKEEQWTGTLAEYKLAADLEPANSFAIQKAMADQQNSRSDRSRASPPADGAVAAAGEPVVAAPKLDPRTKLPVMKYPNVAIRDILGAISNFTGINIQYQPGARRSAVSADDDRSAGCLARRGAQSGAAVERADLQGDEREADLRLPRQPDEPAETRGSIHADVLPAHADIAEIVQIINTMLTTGPIRPVVTQNKTANSIVVRATMPVMDVIRQIIASNDKPRAEVLVDVRSSRSRARGSSSSGWTWSQYTLGFTMSPELAPPNAGTTANAFPAQPPPFNLNTLSKGVAPNDFYVTAPSAMIRALESDTKTRLLAKPQLRGREGDPLTLNLGDDIPYPTTSFLPTATGGVPTQPQISYSYRPVGVNLSITRR